MISWRTLDGFLKVTRDDWSVFNKLHWSSWIEKVDEAARRQIKEMKWTSTKRRPRPFVCNYQEWSSITAGGAEKGPVSAVMSGNYTYHIDVTHRCRRHHGGNNHTPGLVCFFVFFPTLANDLFIMFSERKKNPRKHVYHKICKKTNDFVCSSRPHLPQVTSYCSSVDSQTYKHSEGLASC